MPLHSRPPLGYDPPADLYVRRLSPSLVMTTEVDSPQQSDEAFFFDCTLAVIRRIQLGHAAEVSTVLVVCGIDFWTERLWETHAIAAVLRT
jgi:hypothetical protein